MNQNECDLLVSGHAQRIQRINRQFETQVTSNPTTPSQAQRVKRTMFRMAVATAMVALALGLPVAASAHPHTVSTPHHTQQIARGQNHGPFNADGETCSGDPAAYGIETAHHGPDSGTSGKADGCYQVGSMPPGSDDQNPAID